MDEKKLLKKKEKASLQGNQEQYAQSCNCLGDYYNRCGQYKDAVLEYKDELTAYSALGKTLEVAKAHRMVGEMFMLMSEFENALEHIRIYERLVKNLANKVEEQRAYATLGRVFLLYGQSLQNSNEISNAKKQLIQAEKVFIKSLLICKELSGQISKIELLDMQARLYLNIGVVKEHMEDYSESMSYMEKAIKISKTNDIYELLHLCYISASLLYQYKVNDTALALKFANLALEVAERLPENNKKVCETLLTKSEVLIKIGDFQSAKHVLHKAYKLGTPDLNDRQSVEKNLKIVVSICRVLDTLITTESNNEKKKLYETLGDGCCSLQNYEKAIEYYEKMLECVELHIDAPSNLIPIYVSLYQTYKDIKNYEKSLEYLWKELDLNKNKPEEAFNTLCNIAEVCELTKKPFWTIQEIYQKAIKEAEKAENIKLEKIATIRLWKLQNKYNMNILADELKHDAMRRSINIEDIEEDCESEEVNSNIEENTPDIGNDVCLDDLTDSQSESENTTIEKQKNLNQRCTRKRGRCLTLKRNMKGETQLHQACIAGNIELARLLIEQGHLVNVRDHAGWLPLHEACNHGHRDIVEILLDYGATINDKGGTNCDGVTPLYDACNNGHLDVVELLLQRGANIAIKTDSGNTALDILEIWWQSADCKSEKREKFEQISNIMRERLAKIGKIKSPRESITSTSFSYSSLDKLEQLAYDEKCEKLSPEYSDNDENSSDGDNTRGKERNFVFPYAKQPDIDAKNQYKLAIKNLKHPQREQFPKNIDTTYRSRGAFMKSNEVDIDHWLDDDLGPEKKKIKLKSICNSTEKQMNETFEKRKSTDSISLKSLEQEFHFDNIDNVSLQNQSDFNTSSEIRPNFKKTTRKLSFGSKLKRNRQSSLLENGFLQFRSESPTGVEKDCSSTESEPTTCSPLKSQYFNFNVDNNFTQIKTQQNSAKSCVSFKVQVENELLLVPVEQKIINEVNIKWLSKEVAKRYYNLVGLKPVLRLMTSDGFVFEENDALTAAMDETMISSKVLEWKLSTLGQRYEEMCHQTNSKFNTSIYKIMENAQISNSILLDDLCLLPHQTEPIFKALLHQNNLRILDLSNNCVQNDGCKQLGKSLFTLIHLKSLNLSGNCITSDGIVYLFSQYSEHSPCSELESINLSYNPIGNNGINYLNNFCKNFTKNLVKLNLCSCSVSDIKESYFNNIDLAELDFSFNKLNINSFSYLLNLNFSKMENLFINFSLKNLISNSGSIINKLFETGNCVKIKNLGLSGLNLSDSDIYNLVHNLSGSSSDGLEKIDLTQNSKLTFSSFQYILEKMNNIREIIFNQCPQIMDVSRLENLHINSIDKKLPNLISFDINENSLNIKIEAIEKFWKINTESCGYIERNKNNIRLVLR